MKLAIITEDCIEVRNYFQSISDKCNNDLVIARYVFFNYKHINQKDKLKTELEFSTAFGLTLFNYLLIIIWFGVISAYFIFNTLNTLLFAIPISIFFCIPMLIQSKLVVYIIVKKGLSKQNYVGYIKWD